LSEKDTRVLKELRIDVDVFHTILSLLQHPRVQIRQEWDLMDTGTTWRKPAAELAAFAMGSALLNEPKNRGENAIGFIDLHNAVSLFLQNPKT
jgi:hypothetical protein